MNRFRWARPISALALTLAVASCGDAGSTPATSLRTSAGTSAGTNAGTSAGTNAGTERGAKTGAALGVDEVTWPGRLAEARALFDRMPAALAGAEVRHPRFFRGAAGVQYGRGDEAPTVWVMEAGRDVPDAPAALAVMFGLTMACVKDSYVGTIPPSRYGGVPEMDFSGAYRPGGDPWWFACTIDGAEGDPGFTGHALGWASGDLGWLTVTPDRATTRLLVDALLDAR